MYPNFEEFGWNWQMHEQTAKNQISQDIDTVCLESLLSAWLNALTDLSLLGLQAIFVGLDIIIWTWFEFSGNCLDLWK